MLKSVGRLVVVAAPSGSGKSVFLAHLVRRSIPEIAATIGVGEAAEWSICDAGSLAQLRNEHIERLIVAYAIPAPPASVDTAPAPLADPKLSVTSLARETTFVTLLVSSRTLSDRFRQRMRSNLTGFFRDPVRFVTSRRRARKLLAVYRDAGRIAQMYENWFAYTATVRSKGSWIVDAEAKYVLKGWFRRTVRTENRGRWVDNAEAKYTLHDACAWTQLLRRIENPTNGGPLAAGEPS